MEPPPPPLTTTLPPFSPDQVSHFMDHYIILSREAEQAGIDRTVNSLTTPSTWPKHDELMKVLAARIKVEEKALKRCQEQRSKFNLTTRDCEMWDLFTQRHGFEQRNLVLVHVELGFILKEHDNNDKEMKALRTRIRAEERSTRNDVFRQTALRDYLKEVLSYDYELLYKLVGALENARKVILALNKLCDYNTKIKTIEKDQEKEEWFRVTWGVQNDPGFT